jgi:hypothetical protein
LVDTQDWREAPMDNKIEESTSQEAHEPEAVEELRAAWLALLGLLAEAVVRRLDEGSEPQDRAHESNGSERSGRRTKK